MLGRRPGIATRLFEEAALQGPAAPEENVVRFAESMAREPPKSFFAVPQDAEDVLSRKIGTRKNGDQQEIRPGVDPAADFQRIGLDPNPDPLQGGREERVGGGSSKKDQVLPERQTLTDGPYREAGVRSLPDLGADPVPFLDARPATNVFFEVDGARLSFRVPVDE
jgi:hypothetical protein